MPGLVDTAPLFAPLHAELIALLRSLTPDEWLRPTIAGRWRVRDVAAHLLDTDLRKVAVYRDGHVLMEGTPPAGPADVARLVNRLNAEGVQYARRLSTRQIVDLLEITGRWSTTLAESLPLRGRAIFPVSWAGETESENWMDTGREYTERWHHQMQVRDAVGRPLLLESYWVRPLLDICVHVLPLAYDGTSAPDGTVVHLHVEADDPMAWTIRCDAGRWGVAPGALHDPHCTVRVSADAIWRLLFNALPDDVARASIRVEGEPRLAEPLLRARSVVV
jgi:uncharacterized protein (TIGR03083 family)